VGDCCLAEQKMGGGFHLERFVEIKERKREPGLSELTKFVLPAWMGRDEHHIIISTISAHTVWLPAERPLILNFTSPYCIATCMGRYGWRPSRLSNYRHISTGGLGSML